MNKPELFVVTMETLQPHVHSCVKDWSSREHKFQEQTNVLCNSYTKSAGQDVALHTSCRQLHYIPLFFFAKTPLWKFQVKMLKY